MKTRTVFNDGSPIWLKFISGLLLTFFVLTMVNVGGGVIVSAFDSPDDVIEQERKASCDRIRAKEEKCHEGKECDLSESAEWHAAKFGENIVNCFSFNAELLTFGVGNQ